MADFGSLKRCRTRLMPVENADMQDCTSYILKGVELDKAKATACREGRDISLHSLHFKVHRTMLHLGG